MAKHSTGSEVRAWARTEGNLPEGVPVPKEGRGRLDTRVVAAFDKAHPRAKYLPASKAPAPTVEVKVKPEKGRTVTKRVNVAAARAWASDNGHEVGAKGTLSQAVLVAFAKAQG